ncbi:ATPase [Mycolicibacterium canariasense]|uniref:ATPase n=1 Tax=Mycolicibacterium canariasense TaxID=228230 RepID=UPI0032D57877
MEGYAAANSGVNDRAEVLLIGGRSGVGKSSVAFECHEVLLAEDISHAVIDGDMLDLAYPVPWEHGLAERNLSAIWANYRSLGFRRLIFVGTACVLPDESTKIIAAMGDRPRVVPVLLTCTDATATHRLRQRETGTGFNRHRGSSQQMATTLAAGINDDVHLIATDDRSVCDVAADVLACTPWRAPTAD